MTDETARSPQELVDAALAAYQEAQEAHDSFFGGSCPYHFFPDSWAFGPDNVGLTRVEFEAAIRRLEEDWRRDDPSWEYEPWNPDEVVLRVGRVLILYEPDPAGNKERLFRVADLRSEDGERFTAGELLCKFYRAAAADLRGSCHRHFEGLQFRGVVSTAEGHVPIYQVTMGS
jgi:hypothetical protein